MRDLFSHMASFLEREAGRVCVGFVLLGTGGVFHVLHLPKGEDIVMFALGLLATVMHAGRHPQPEAGPTAAPPAQPGPERPPK